MTDRRTTESHDEVSMSRTKRTVVSMRPSVREYSLLFFYGRIAFQMEWK